MDRFIRRPRIKSKLINFKEDGRIKNAFAKFVK